MKLNPPRMEMKCFIRLTVQDLVIQKSKFCVYELIRSGELLAVLGFMYRQQDSNRMIHHCICGLFVSLLKLGQVYRSRQVGTPFRTIRAHLLAKQKSFNRS